MCIICKPLAKCITKRQHKMFMNLLHPIAVLIMLAIIFFLFVYEMCFIIPELLGKETLIYKIHWVLSAFIMHNILGNMWICSRTDTSLKSLPIKAQDPPPGEANQWRLCTHCQMMVPPRAWHCSFCKCCSLKRDHHCHFTANCIGHNNHRYFVCFLFYLTLGSGLSLLYNAVNFWIYGSLNYIDPIMIYGSAFARTRAMQGEGFEWMVISSTVLKLNVFAFVAAAVQFGFQALLIYRNSTYFKMQDRTYDLGFWNNMELVLGKRCLWSFVSPFIESPLPHDGTHWQLAKQRV